MISAEDHASRLHTINYEVTCLIGQRVPRLYLKGGKVVKVKSAIMDKDFWDPK